MNWGKKAWPGLEQVWGPEFSRTRPRLARFARRFSVSPHSSWEAVRRLILNRQIPSLKHASVHDVPARAIVMLSSSF